MAATSTNKQPLLVDRPLHKQVDLSGALVGTLPPDTAVDPQTAAGALLVDCTKNDGAVIDTIWTISREIENDFYEEDPNKVPNPPQGKFGYLVNFYLCPSNTVLIPDKAYFVTAIVAGVDEGERVQSYNLPEVIAPVAAMGSIEAEGGEVKPTQYRALYVPKGQCLWAAAVQQHTIDGTTDAALNAPLACVQGGYF
jgi:hypothetical protein